MCHPTPLGEDPYWRIFGRFSIHFKAFGGGAKPVKIPNNQVSFHFKGKFSREPPFMDFYFRAFQNNCAPFWGLLWKSFRLNHLGFHIVA